VTDEPRDLARISLLLALVSVGHWPLMLALACLAFPFSILLLVALPLCWLSLLGTGIAAMWVGDKALQRKRGSRRQAKAGSLIGFFNCMLVLLVLLFFALGQ
jgi:hypothetical protein